LLVDEQRKKGAMIMTTDPTRCPASADGRHQIDLDSVHAREGSDPLINAGDIDACCALCGAEGYVAMGALPPVEDWVWMDPPRT
jgi:hypothetical protein